MLQTTDPKAIESRLKACLMDDRGKKTTNCLVQFIKLLQRILIQIKNYNTKKICGIMIENVEEKHVGIWRQDFIKTALK